jgi:hypothetical protein
MPLTPCEAFQIGFLTRCADEALTGTQVRTRIEKAASFIEKRAINLTEGLANLGGMGFNTALSLGIAAPVGLGVLGGVLANKATEDSISDEDVQKRELIDELKHWARRAREQRRMRQLLPP